MATGSNHECFTYSNPSMPRKQFRQGQLFERTGEPRSVFFRHTILQRNRHCWRFHLPTCGHDDLTETGDAECHICTSASYVAGSKENRDKQFKRMRWLLKRKSELHPSRDETYRDEMYLASFALTVLQQTGLQCYQRLRLGHKVHFQTLRPLSHRHRMKTIYMPSWRPLAGLWTERSSPLWRPALKHKLRLSQDGISFRRIVW